MGGQGGDEVTKTDLRVEAMRLAVATTGNSNKVALAIEYLTFLSADFTEPSAPHAIYMGPEGPEVVGGSKHKQGKAK